LERGKTCSAKSGKQSACNKSLCSPKFTHRHSGIPLLRLFSLHIYPQTGVNVVMFVCSLSLWNKYVCTTLVMLKKTVSMLFTFQQTYLHFLGMEMMGSSREITVGWLLLYTPKPKSHHNYFQKEFWISFQLFLKVLAHTETILLLLLTQHWEHKFGESPMHHQIVFQNALN